jgi:tRNA nucleotidyltransferase (CCA-adding enzyme)
VRDLESDLSRRDFTVNALAYSPERGLVDMFGGLRDIGDRVIRCVGDPETRFKEDGLRILRALRFASRLGFSIDSATDRAIRKCRTLLDNISAERIFSELCGILTGDGAEQVVYDYSDVMFQIMPELEPMSRTEQNNPHHIYNVWEHTVKALGASEKGQVMRLAMLFHDSGKPARKTTDENGIDNFHGHPEVSCDIARTVLNRLRCDNQTKDDVLFLVRYHDTRFSPKDNRVRKFIADVGEERFRELMKAKRADMAAQSRMSQEKTGEELRRLGDILEEMKSSGACMSLKDMEINGRDLVEMGVPQGKTVGELLNRLYDMVVTEEIENNREQLIRKARQLIDGELTEM